MDPPAVPAQCVVCCKEAAQVYCIPDAAALCLACDQQIHGRNPLAARHVRVQLCELCEAVPAAVYCRQDAASLCNACNTEVHATNPLASRHEGTRVAASANAAEIEEYRRRCEELLNGDEGGAAPPPMPARHPGAREEPGAHGSGGPARDSASGLQGRPGSGGWKKGGARGGEPLDQFESLFGSDFAELDSDGPIEFAFLQAQGLLTEFGGGFDGAGGLGWQQGGVARMGASQYGEAALERRAPRQRPEAGGGQFADDSGIELMGREARVLRYKEKRKNRKFDKTIRYASRKAYAEARPRVKGRFVKREDGGAEGAAGGAPVAGGAGGAGATSTPSAAPASSAEDGSAMGGLDLSLLSGPEMGSLLEPPLLWLEQERKRGGEMS